MRAIFKTLSLTVIALGLALGCRAQGTADDEEKPFDGPVYPRPAASPGAINFQVVPFMADGFRSTRSELSCHLFAANTLPPQNWVRVSLPGTSLSSQGAYYPKVKWAMYLWPPDSFLPNLSDLTLTGYAEGIKQTYPEQVEILNYDSGYRSQVIPVIFNRDPRMLAYKITDPATGAVTLRYDTFVLFDESLLEFSIWGPPDEVKNMLGWFSVIPENLSLTTPDKSYEEDTQSAYTNPPPPEAETGDPQNQKPPRGGL